MCDTDHEWEWHGAFASSDAPSSQGISRRDLLRVGALGAGAVAVGSLLPGSARAATPVTAPFILPGMDGASPFRTAQHIHARGSEGPGSMTAQATEASKWVDVMWFTDHDYKEAGIGAPDVVHFNSLTAERLGENPPWTWTSRNTVGLDTSSMGGIEHVDISPNDPDPTGALYARAVAAGSAPASLVWWADDSKLRNSMRTPAHGQNWAIDVLLREISNASWGFLRVALSYHPSSGGRANAYYFLEYRFGTFPTRSYSVETLDVSADTFVDAGGDGGGVTLFPGEQALVGVVHVPTTPGTYATQHLNFTDDIATLFPDMIARDNSIRGLWLGATSVRAGAAANVVFDYLRMNRIRGQAQFEDRGALTAELAPQFPSLTMYNGTEVSYAGGHRHWLGGQIVLSTYGGTTKAQGAPAPSHSEDVATILAAGGMPIANHPYGTNGPKLTDAAAAAKAKDYVTELLSTNAEGGLQGIETFYRNRAGASLEHHWRLYRLAVRNGLVLTATGVSDNHWGRVGSWDSEANHFQTTIYSNHTSESSLLAAQAKGRAFSSEISSYAGQLDLALDSDVMGQIGVRPGRLTRTLHILGTQLPKGSFAEVWQIPVDFGGLDAEPGGVVARVPAASFSGDLASITVDTGIDCAYAVMLITSRGRRIAGSNPVWHLTREPTRWVIPNNRRAV